MASLEELELKLKQLTEEQQELKQEIAELRAEVKELKQEVAELRAEVWTDISVAPEYSISSFGRVKRKKPRMDGSDFYPKISVNKRHGYYQVNLNGKPYLLHRLLAQAFIPNPENKPFVDHIDGDPLNNSLSNLRWCTYTENGRNRKKHRNNTSGYKGVYFNKAAGKWRARIKINGKNKSLGYFHTKEEAAAAYEAAAKEAFGEFYRET